jgi:hypothetical protein
VLAMFTQYKGIVSPQIPSSGTASEGLIAGAKGSSFFANFEFLRMA